MSRTVYKVSGVGGTYLFSSKAEAEKAVKSTPSDWGRAVGAGRPTIQEERLFDSFEEWKKYKGWRWDPR